MAYFTLMAIVLIVVKRKQLRDPNEDEHASSREFWMFMGMLVLVISAVQVTITTSIPVINKMFGTKMAPPADAVDFYNSWQLPLAVIIALLIAVAQFFKWKKSNGSEVTKKLALSFISALVIAGIFEYYFRFPRVQHVLLLFTSIWAFTANLDYLVRILKGNIKHSGSSIAHMGIALILLGALISNVEKQVISRNMLNVDLGKDFPNNENILLYQGDTLAMGEYYVSYKGKEKEGVNLFYEIEYFKANHGSGTMEKQFSLKPIVQLNNRMGNVSEPATHRFIARDIYTHITYAELDEDKAKADEEGYKEAKEHMMKVGDTIVASNSMYTFYELDKNIDKKAYELNEDDLAVGAKIKVTDVNRKEYFVEPVFVLRGSTPFTLFAEVKELGLKFGFTKIDPETGKMEIRVAEKLTNSRDFVIMKAIIFPQINLLWTGCILMFIGTWVAIRKRIIDSKKA